MVGICVHNEKPY